MHRFAALLVIAAAIGSACGGGGEDAAPETTGEPGAQRSTTVEPATEPAETTATDTEPATTREEREPVGTGKEIFLAAGCGDCHTLEAAGTAGTVGPNLDEHLTAHHGGVEHVAMKVRQGGGGMPSFAGTLSDEEIRRVARFVHRATAQ